MDSKSGFYPFKFMLLTTFVLLSLVVASVAAADSATQLIENLHAELLTVMKQANELGYEGRYQRLDPIVTSSYDLPFIAKFVMGRQWKTLSAEQKSEFVKTFTKLSIAIYAANFSGYSGERFKTISNEELRKGRLLVKSVLIRSSGGEVTLDYVLHQREDRWRIINAIAEGVSDLSLKRADYSSYLKKKGFDGLIIKLNEKIQNYAK
jgi:phospholipid transport system substrate-binding protein